MTPPVEVPAWAALLTGLLVLVGAGLTLIGCLGFLRLGTFYDRVHPPTLGTTAGATCVVLASIIHLSVVNGQTVLGQALIVLFVTVTTPVTLMLLVRAAVSRDRREGREPIGESTPPLARGEEIAGRRAR
ncbi:MAG TPA: monovalent cation/H(+) antiporter subunit G [Thermodesulfobacteriota bacterium]